MTKPKVFYGWIVCLAAFLATAAFGFFYAYSVFFIPWMAEFGWSREQIASIFSLYPIVFSISGILFGRLIDKYGPRKVIMSGAILLALGIGLCSQANSLWELRLFFGVVAATGIGALYVPPLYCAQKWFVKGRGLAMGIVTSGVAFGTLVSAPLATYLIEKAGWRGTFLIFAIGLGILLLVAAALIRGDPNDKGLKPYGYEAREREKANEPPQVGGLTLRLALKTSSFWLPYAAYALGFLCVTLVMVHIVPYARDIGLSPMAAAGTLGVMGILNIVGRLALGRISDKIGRKWGLVISYAFIPIVMLGLLTVREAWMLYLLAALLGFSYGGFVALYAAIIGDYFGPAFLGMILAIAITAYGIGGAIGPYIGGVVFENSGSYQLAFLICAMCGILAIIATAFSKPPKLING